MGRNGSKKHPDAVTVAKALCKYIVPWYGIPRIIWSDNASHFVSKVVEKTGKNLGIQLKHHCSYHPQSGGLVKGANGPVKSRLKKCMAEPGRAWPECLYLVKKGANKLSLFEILYSRLFKLPIVNSPLSPEQMKKN